MRKLVLFCLIMIESSFVYLFYILVKDGAQPFDAKRALMIVIFALVVTLFLFFFRRSHKSTSRKKVKHTKRHANNDTSDSKKMLAYLEEEFEYVIYDFSEGRRAHFEVHDIEIITEYIQLKTGQETYGSFNGKQSLVFETADNMILFELIESQIEMWFDNQQKRYKILVNHLPIYHLTEIFNA